ncbi:PKD domain-containing protein [Bythopirellula polymerisocia]|uniref:PA14 domain protein n=1 Tax=Bythopirellula polymerisocia TaxID=2528003 RepID=A0A5C6D1A6_9BACT|nr:DUF5060 domain-containing protein [Bythopirellula polymerisocia]TWU28679.1 PA14 domain protein [Bythopirellula polymerisocia]
MSRSLKGKSRTVSTNKLRFETLEPRIMLTGDGLLGEYFNSIALTQPGGSRIDAVVNFPIDALGEGAQGQVTADDNYSIRWTGWVEAQQSGSWQFTTFSNDGVRLWVDDTQIINNWGQHASERDDGSITLAAGWHPIRMEYFQEGGSADARLLFSGPGQSEVVIPQMRLSSTNPNPDDPVANAGLDRVVVLPSSSVVLDGSGTDNGAIAGYQWSQLSGPNTATLSGATNEDLTASNLIEGVYSFQLTVTDDQSNTDSNTATVQVVPETGGGIVSGELKQWHKVSIDFAGPNTSETAAVNPFTDYRLDVTFTHHESLKSYVVPGYYATDGNAANTSATAGNVWRVHFAPDEIGAWTYSASFRTGSNVAMSTSANPGSSAGFFDGASGAFEIAATDKSGRDLRGKGRLDYVGERYLRFAGDGDYFLKQGPDAPENLLAYEDFDNTPDNGGRRKSYSAHAGDWNPGDPSWQNGKGTELIGAVNYLASEGLNAFSFLPMNINGDDKNVFPYISDGSADRLRMDVSKLDQWEIVFEHANQEGFFLHFKTQETENDQLLDGGALGNQRRLYYRELIARFGHNLALNWNLGEENTNTTQQRKDFAQFFYDNDPYHHHIVLHTYPGEKAGVYEPLLGDASKLTGASLQTSDADFNYVHGDTVQWVNESANTGRPWAIAVDEPGDAQHALRPDNDVGNSHEDGRKNALWGTLMGGGYGNEWYFGYGHAHSDLTLEDFRSRDNWWDYTRYAMEFFYDNDIPFWEMQNDNDISSAFNDYGFYKPGEVYVGYLKNGGTTNMDLSDAAGQFEVKWFDPRNGGDLQDGSVTIATGGGSRSVGQAPNSTSQDWVVLVRKQLIVDQVPFGDAPREITDGSIIQFEDYDYGGEGKSYHDSDAVSMGDLSRGDSVDGGSASGVVGERIGWTEDGEWLEYTVDVTAGIYYATVRYASGSPTEVGSLRLLLGDGPDGDNFSEIGTFDLENTGGWANWDFLTLPGIAVSGGAGKVLRAEIIGRGFDLDQIEFTTSPPVNNPPSITIDDVSLVVDESLNVYQEQGGLVVMEMENTPSDLGLWNLEPDATNYANPTGDGYLQFTGNDPASGPPNSPLEYKFKINQPGLYYLHLRAARDTTHGQEMDKSNDAYVRVEGDYGAGPNAGNSHGDDAPLSMLMSDTKFFGGAADSFAWAWGNRLDPGGQNNKRVAVYDFKAGEEYTLVVSGRSQYFSVDRIMFRHASVGVSAAQNLGNPESPQPGAGDGMLRYQINASVTDDARLMYPPTLQWTAESGPGTVTFDDPNAEDVFATFSVDGTYLLQLTANDGEFTTKATRTIVVPFVDPPASEQAFTPIDDAMVEGTAGQNTGLIKVQTSGPTRTGYFKFNVSGLNSQNVVAASLRLTVTQDPGSGNLNLYQGTTNAWSETTVNSSNAPGQGALIDTVGGTHALGQVVEFDVSSVIDSDGTYTFVLKHGGSDDVWFSSKEGSNAPQLIVDIGGNADFVKDNVIDGADFLAWQRGVGLANARHYEGDANGDGSVDGADLSIWQNTYGNIIVAPIASFQENDLTERDDLLALQEVQSVESSVIHQLATNSPQISPSLVDAAMARLWLETGPAYPRLQDSQLAENVSVEAIDSFYSQAESIEPSEKTSNKLSFESWVDRDNETEAVATSLEEEDKLTNSKIQAN